MQLATALEVSTRTILRDVDAMTEAGLPIIVHRGNQGGIELGFDYRTRLTGLAADEAEALGVMLSRPMPELAQLGLERSGRTAINKLIESFPDKVRAHIADGANWFPLAADRCLPVDPRITALAEAIRGRHVVRLNAKSAVPRVIHPIQLRIGSGTCAVVDRHDPDQDIPRADWGDINISAKRFG